jgi:hypothetical protein
MTSWTYAKWCLDSCRVLKSNSALGKPWGAGGRGRSLHSCSNGLDLMMRTILLEIGLSVRDKACPNIGPVQKIQTPILSNACSVSQPVATLPSTVGFLSQFRGQPVVGFNPFQNALQLTGIASLHMNMTTV